MVWAYILSYKVVFSAKIKIKIPDLTKPKAIPVKESTYHRIEKPTKEMPGFLSPKKGVPFLLNPEYSGINKDQRILTDPKQHTGSLLLNAS